VESPGRYISREIGSTQKDLSRIDIRVALAFPDLYELGMSHLGMGILYQVLNDLEFVACERAFLPAFDMQKQMLANGIPLAMHESRTPLREAHVIGYSIQTEVAFPAMVRMMLLAGIPVQAKERKDLFPLVIAGGTAICNPAPIAAFLDAVVVGDGEEVVKEISHTLRGFLKGSPTKSEVLQALAKIQGVYVPDVHRDKPNSVKKALIMDLDGQKYFTNAIVPFKSTVHDRLTVEIHRGCVHGCRFCQAGYTYRPLRQRKMETVLKTVEKCIDKTGFEQVSFLSLNSIDWKPLLSTVQSLHQQFKDRGVSVSLPSLRVDQIKDETLFNEISSLNKSSFTFAIEAATDRLRQVINKNIKESDIMNTIDRASHQGITTLKVYFMVGLPGETMEDVLEIPKLLYRIYERARTGHARMQINATVSPFVPKPFTPFQWSRQESIEEFEEKVNSIKSNIHTQAIKIKNHNVRMSAVDGILSRGDERLSPVIEEIARRGTGLDSWDDQFDFNLWQEVLTKHGFTFEKLQSERDPAVNLPWDMINVGLTKKYFQVELNRSQKALETPHCMDRVKCTVCGICDQKQIFNILAGMKQEDEAKILTRVVEADSADDTPESNTPERFCFRLQFTKRGDLKYLGHLELMKIIHRFLRRVRAPFILSQGFSPKIKVSFGHALPLGVESDVEFLDLWLTRADFFEGLPGSSPSSSIP
jgi:radical SAM family uncharacterized protein